MRSVFGRLRDIVTVLRTRFLPRAAPLKATYYIPDQFSLAVFQVLPKHTLEAVLVALCGVRMDEGSQTSGWGAGPGGSDGSNPGQVAGSCVWTELTMPVITAAVNLKPPLSENAIGVVVRRVEAAAELPELQVCVRCIYRLLSPLLLNRRVWVVRRPRQSPWRHLSRRPHALTAPGRVVLSLFSQ